MDVWHIGRLLTAAEFTGHFLKLRLAVLMRGDNPWLLLQIVADPDVEVMDEDYARWSPGFRAQVPANWPRSTGNPWSACAYSGPMTTLAVNEVDRLIAYVSGGGKNTAARLTAVIDAHLDATSFDLRTRRMLLRFLKKDFECADVSTVVRPAEADSGYDLTLNAAFEIHQAVAAGMRLSTTQRRQAAVLLKYAPWQFGYWGPFKSLVKSAPAESLADAYAIAVARLSSTDGAVAVPTDISIEGVDELEGWFGIPSKRTQQYLARRVRRDFASLAERLPEVYARVATRMLISWDQRLSNYSYAPAFVMLGARSPLDVQSRYVLRPADMTERRDPHPETWNARPELAYRVFRSIRSSVEALTWAFQVLDSTGTTPELPTASIALGLQSTYPPLRQSACTALPRRPKLIGTLTKDQWAAFLRHGSDAELKSITDAMTSRQIPLALSDTLGPLLAPAEAQSDRRSHFALLYLGAPGTSGKHGDSSTVGAVIAVIESSGMQHQSLWGPVIAEMGPWNVLRVYRSLVDRGATGAPLDVVGNALLIGGYISPDLILDCIASDANKIVDLGWRIIDARGGRQFLFTQLLPSAGSGVKLGSGAVTRVAEAAMLRVEEPRDAGALLRWALTAGIDSHVLAGILSGNRAGLIGVWDALVTEKDGRITGWIGVEPDVIPLIAETLTTEQVNAAKQSQLRLILDYVRRNPGRVEPEEQFRLAAIRSTDPKLQGDALRQLRRAGNLQRSWLKVAESGLPAGLDAARKYLESLKNIEQLRGAILECLASGAPAIQDMGIQLVRSREALANDPAVLVSLGRSDARLAQILVAEAASAGAQVDQAVLVDFDRRVLTDRLSSPRARELVKKRLEVQDVASEPASAERIVAIVQMAQSGNKGDREWALTRLATWALHGAVIDGFEISLTTEGVVGLDDVAP